MLPLNLSPEVDPEIAIMDIEMVVLRALHIALGVFWAGAAFFLTSFVLPTARKSWPASAEWIRSLIGPRFQRGIAIAAGLTVLAGLRMMWKLSGNFSAAWMTSANGMLLAIGGLCGIAAFVIGAVQLGPAATRMIARLESAERAGDSGERQRQTEAAQADLAAFGGALRVASALLGLTVLMMAIARYVR